MQDVDLALRIERHADHLRHINVRRKLQEIFHQLEGKLRRRRSRLLGSGGADDSNRIIERHRNQGQTRGDKTSGDRLQNTHWLLPAFVLTIATSAAWQIKSKRWSALRARARTLFPGGRAAAFTAGLQALLPAGSAEAAIGL